ncbi:MAG: calcium/sodium antiporter [Thermotogae bacterium]|nr:calcium/sodium antiporter [Thermotogota bacterium]
MEVVKDVLLIVLGISLLVKGADYLIDGSLGFVRRLKIPEIVVGLTLVAFGTSLPELVVNVMASLQGSTDVTFGNIIGSNIANILLILGVTALISPIKRHALIVKRDIPLNLVLVILLMILVLLPEGRGEMVLERWEGLFLLFFFAAYLYLNFFKGALALNEGDMTGKSISSLGKSLVWVIVGSIALTLGSKWALDGALNLSQTLKLSGTFIGLFILAVGTSLPELVTSVVAALRGNPYIAIGNVSGSNIFNIGMILGLSAFIHPIDLPSRATFDMGMLLLITFVFPLVTFGNKPHLMGRRRGLMFLLLYVTYLLVSLKIEHGNLTLAFGKWFHRPALE